MRQVTLTKDSVVEFLNRFEQIAANENFDLIQDVINDKAFFRFNDGDFVAQGRNPRGVRENLERQR